MNIIQLLNSTYKVGPTRTASYVFSNKKFGKIYAHNKTVHYKPRFDIIEFTMFISAVTDIKKTAHKVDVSIKGMKFEEISIDDLVARVNQGRNKDDSDTVDSILNKILDNEEIIKGKIVLPTESGKKFLIINKKVPLTSQVRVRCSCSDYYYVWGWYNADKGAHIGRKPTPYTPKKLRESSNGERVTIRNKDKRPGVCKHIMMLLALLMEEKLLNNSSAVSGAFHTNNGRFEIYSHSDINKMISKTKREIQRLNKLRGEEHKEQEKFKDTYTINANKGDDEVVVDTTEVEE